MEKHDDLPILQTGCTVLIGWFPLRATLGLSTLHASPARDWFLVHVRVTEFGHLIFFNAQLTLSMDVKWGKEMSEGGRMF